MCSLFHCRIWNSVQRFGACRYLIPMFGLICLSAFASGCAHVPAGAEEEVHAAPVKALSTQALSLGQWTSLVGTTQPLPKRLARITAPVEGRVLLLLDDGQGKALTEGQQVQAGQVIAQLDDRVLRANHAKLAASQTELGEQRTQADLAVRLARINLDSKIELNRSAGSGSQHLVPETEMERARLALQDAESKQRGAVLRLQSGLAELKALETQLDLMTLKAPIAGRLGLVQVAPGQTLAAGATVAEVLDLQEVDVLCYVPAFTAAKLAVGQPARLATTSGTQGDIAPATGKVVFIAVQAHPDTGAFAVKVRFPNADLKLRSNSVATVQVMTQPERERFTFPEAALMEDQDPPTVFVVRDVETKTNAEGKEEKFGKVHRYQALLGVRDRNWHVVEILKLVDLEKEPDKRVELPVQDALIVVEGGHGLHDDDIVKLDEGDD